MSATGIRRAGSAAGECSPSSVVQASHRSDNSVYFLQVSKAARDLQSKNSAALQPILDKLKGAASGEQLPSIAQACEVHQSMMGSVRF
jgi:hypothetical protein